MNGEFNDPTTGEVFFTSDVESMEQLANEKPELIAEWIDSIDEQVREVQAERARLSQYLIARMDSDATQTLHAGKYVVKVNGASDEYEDYDADALLEELADLRAEAVISPAAIDKAVKTSFRVSKTGVKSLLALRNEAVTAAVEKSKVVKRRVRRVTVGFG